MNKKHWKEPFDSLELKIHIDPRGMLFEILRFKDHNIPGNGQLYTFSINPGQRRGDHYHLKKQEWFSCVHGEAIVLLTSKNGENKAIEISAGTPKIVYASPETTHALINKQNNTAVIVSYGSVQHDQQDTDTYRKTAYPELSVE
jgi:dTDP-4-dehydrorhamnose 3,5-epimerase